MTIPKLRHLLPLTLLLAGACSDVFGNGESRYPPPVSITGVWDADGDRLDHCGSGNACSFTFDGKPYDARLRHFVGTATFSTGADTITRETTPEAREVTYTVPVTYVGVDSLFAYASGTGAKVLVSVSTVNLSTTLFAEVTRRAGESNPEFAGSIVLAPPSPFLIDFGTVYTREPHPRELRSVPREAGALGQVWVLKKR